MLYRQVNPCIGDLVPMTPLERDYAAYAAFCQQRSIRPAAFGDVIKAQAIGWKTTRRRSAVILPAQLCEGMQMTGHDPRSAKA